MIGTSLPVLAAASPIPAFAQGTSAADAGVAAIRAQWEQQSGYLLRPPEQMPEADYAFKPVATVRSFGQLIAHVAGSQYSMCASALGEPAREEDEIEKSVTTKAKLVEALRASTEYCRRAYALSDADAARHRVHVRRVAHPHVGAGAQRDPRC